MSSVPQPQYTVPQAKTGVTAGRVPDTNNPTPAVRSTTVMTDINNNDNTDKLKKETKENVVVVVTTTATATTTTGQPPASIQARGGIGGGGVVPPQIGTTTTPPPTKQTNDPVTVEIPSSGRTGDPLPFQRPVATAVTTVSNVEEEKKGANLPGTAATSASSSSEPVGKSTNPPMIIKQVVPQQVSSIAPDATTTTTTTATTTTIVPQAAQPPTQQQQPQPPTQQQQQPPTQQQQPSPHVSFALGTSSSSFILGGGGGSEPDEALLATIRRQREPLTDLYHPYICPCDTSIHDARQRLHTALEQTRVLRKAFTERVYNKYRVCLVPPPATLRDIVRPIEEDPATCFAQLQEDMEQIRLEKEMEKKEAVQLNTELAKSSSASLSLSSSIMTAAAASSDGGGGGTRGTNAALATASSLNIDHAEQLMYLSAGLNLVILPEDNQITPDALQNYTDGRGPMLESGQRNRAISHAAATSGDVILDRTRKAMAMREERNLLQQQQQQHHHHQLQQSGAPDSTSTMATTMMPSSALLLFGDSKLAAATSGNYTTATTTSTTADGALISESVSHLLPHNLLGDALDAAATASYVAGPEEASTAHAESLVKSAAAAAAATTSPLETNTSSSAAAAAATTTGTSTTTARTGGAGSNKKGVAKTAARGGRTSAILSSTSLLSLLPHADQLDSTHERLAASTAALMARGIGGGGGAGGPPMMMTTTTTIMAAPTSPTILKTQQQEQQWRLRHPHPESLGGRQQQQQRTGTSSTSSSIPPPESCDTTTSDIWDDSSLTLPPLPTAQERLERKPLAVLSPQQASTRRARKAIQTVLEPFQRKNKEGEESSPKSVKYTDFLQHLQKSSSSSTAKHVEGEQPTAGHFQEELGEAASPNSEDMDPHLAFLVFSAIGLIGESGSSSESLTQKLDGLPSASYHATLNQMRLDLSSTTCPSFTSQFLEEQDPDDDDGTRKRDIGHTGQSSTELPPTKRMRSSPEGGVNDSVEEPRIPVESIRGGGDPINNTEAAGNVAGNSNSNDTNADQLRVTGPASGADNNATAWAAHLAASQDRGGVSQGVVLPTSVPSGSIPLSSAGFLNLAQSMEAGGSAPGYLAPQGRFYAAPGLNALQIAQQLQNTTFHHNHFVSNSELGANNNLAYLSRVPQQRPELFVPPPAPTSAADGIPASSQLALGLARQNQIVAEARARFAREQQAAAFHHGASIGFTSSTANQPFGQASQGGTDQVHQSTVAAFVGQSHQYWPSQHPQYRVQTPMMAAQFTQPILHNHAQVVAASNRETDIASETRVNAGNSRPEDGAVQREAPGVHRQPDLPKKAVNERSSTGALSKTTSQPRSTSGRIDDKPKPISGTGPTSLSQDGIKATEETKTKPISATVPTSLSQDVIKATEENKTKPISPTDPTSLSQDGIKATEEIKTKPISPTDPTSLSQDGIKATEETKDAKQAKGQPAESSVPSITTKKEVSGSLISDKDRVIPLEQQKVASIVTSARPQPDKPTQRELGVPDNATGKSVGSALVSANAAKQANKAVPGKTISAESGSGPDRHTVDRLKFIEPKVPSLLDESESRLIQQGCFHSVVMGDKNLEKSKAALEYLLSVSSAVPIAKTLVSGPLKECVNHPGLKPITSGATAINLDIIASTILVWLWGNHESCFQNAFGISGRFDVDPDCKWLIQTTVDISTRELVNELSKGNSTEDAIRAQLVAALKLLSARRQAGGSDVSLETNVSSLSARVDISTALVVSRALAREISIDRGCNELLPKLIPCFAYLDEARLVALQAKAQERTLLANLISRKTTMTESFSHAYVSSMVRAGEAIGHGKLFEVVQNEELGISTMIPYDVFTDETHEWEDPCKPVTGMTMGLTADDLTRRAHARAMIQKSLKKLQDKQNIKGGTLTAGPYADPWSVNKSGAGGGKFPPACSPRTGLKRKYSSSAEPPVPPGTGSAKATNWSVFNPRHFSEALEWNPTEQEVLPYGKHCVLDRPRSLSQSLIARSGDSKRLKRPRPSEGKTPAALSSTTTTTVPPIDATTTPPEQPRNDDISGSFPRSTLEIPWSAVADIFQRVELPKKSASSRTSSSSAGGHHHHHNHHESTPLPVDGKIFAPFCRKVAEIDLLDDEKEEEESETEEDISEAAILARHETVLCRMKQKLSQYMEEKRKQQDRKKNRNTYK